MQKEQTEALRAGIIGCGRIAGSIEEETINRSGFMALPYGHAPAYRAAAGVELVAVADPDGAAAARFANRWDLPNHYTSVQEMLSTEKLDLVSICAPSRFHCELFCEVTTFAGVRGIFLEKPIALSLGQAKTMQAAMEESNVKVVVNHTRTFDPVWQQAKRLIDTGEIGEVSAINARWVEGWSFGGSHLFDLVRYLINSRPVRAYWDSETDAHVDGVGAAYVLYESGVRLQVLMLEAAPGIEVAIFGTNGRIVVDSYGPRLYKRDIDGISGEYQLPFPAMIYWKSAMVAAIEELAAAIETNACVTSGLEDGVVALEIAVALNLSGRSGVPIDFPIVDDSFVVPSA